jgi:primosomal protein N' (replication factor Y) (superfamily II helicase)
VPLYRTFDYLPPAHLDTPLLPGMRVLVSFGRRKLIGVIRAIVDKSDYPDLKTIEAVLDREPLLDTFTLELVQRTHQYYHAPPGEVMHLALPPLLRRHNHPPPDPHYYAVSGTPEHAEELLRRAPKQWAVWQHLHQFGPTELRALNQHIHAPRNIVETLVTKQLLHVQSTAPTLPVPSTTAPDKVLTAEQQQVVDTIHNNNAGFCVHLIHGITGSGKTEVYIQLIRHSLANGYQALVLIPEISLSPQTVRRFQERFTVPVVAQHSMMNEQERYQSWEAMRSGRAKVLIATRSGIFTPFVKLGLIIVDEEHDMSYKQQSGVRYSARDVAVFRARLGDIPVVLGSATPSLESYFNCDKAHYHLHQLTQRANDASLPKLVLEDLRNTPNDQPFSQRALNTIRATLEQGLQVMVFLNRRGFAPVLYCGQCSNTVRCPHCDINLTAHKTPPKLACHHCGYTRSLVRACPHCGHESLVPLGHGTQKITALLESLFPETEVLRIDRDTTRSKHSWHTIYATLAKANPTILVGTQMLAKGHHFPNVALVIILDVDIALTSPDFRAQEYLAQLVVQVSGRAGRGAHQGTVLLQTRDPQNALLSNLLQHNYKHVLDTLLAERKAALFPPVSAMAILRTESLDMLKAQQLLEQAAIILAAPDISIIGPLPAPIEKRAGKFRYQLIIQAPDKPLIQRLFRQRLEMIGALPETRRVKWSVDIDPVSLD